MWCTIQEVLVGARISGARGATWSQKGSGTQAKTFSFKMLKFLLRNLFGVARNRENTESILKCNFCPRGTKVDLPQGLNNYQLTKLIKASGQGSEIGRARAG